ncbi:MAG: cellulose biosynthesis protein BcsS [Afipia sp.]|nr:cellulose biosynthesis protein BcsS [Afipia sp.]
MRCVGTIRAVRVAAALLLACGLSPAFADPLLDDIPSSGELGSQRAQQYLYFAGFDLWRNGGSFYGGAQWAPGGINNDGFTLKVLLAEGSYKYLSGGIDTRGTYLLASVMPGWRIKRGNLEIKAFAGLDLQNHRLSPDDPSNSLRGNRAGLRVNADLWWEPIPATMMLASSISGSTIGNSFGIRGAAGWRVTDRLWAGPEIETSGDEVYRQNRFGAHVTALKTGEFEWALGAGYVEDNSHRSGAYGRLSVLTRR